jgi:leucyl/phenylalanyl-tRNA--protein transferase
MTTAYKRLHVLGHAHSVEVWQDDELVGGLYGIALGGVFFGESMFSRASDASKVALVALCHTLLKRKFAIIDCQVKTAHLESLGATSMSRPEFHGILNKVIDRPDQHHWPMPPRTTQALF